MRYDSNPNEEEALQEHAWAEELGHEEVVRQLTTNLNEEKAADRKLSNVALRKGVNRKAAS